MISSASAIGCCISDSPNYARSKAAPTAARHIRLTENGFRRSLIGNSSNRDLVVRQNGWAARKGTHTKQLPGAGVAGQVIEDEVALVAGEGLHPCLADLGVHQLDLRLPHRASHRARIVGAMALSA